MTKPLARLLGITVALAAALSLGAWAQEMTRESGVNRRGGDYTNFRAHLVVDCESACLRDRRCRAYTFDGHDGICYLKDSVPSAIRVPSRTSGVKRDDRGGDYPGGGYPGGGGRDLSEERGIDYHGGDYTSAPVRGLDECQDRCRSDRRCVSYSYDVRAAVCYLKDRVGDRRRDADKIGGVKERYPSNPGGGGDWEQRGYDYHGGDYTSLRVRGLEECQDECRSDRRCRAYSYDTRAAMCYLKDRVGDLRRDRDKVTGIKRRY